MRVHGETIVDRRKGIDGLKHYQDARSILEEDFHFLCGYCGKDGRIMHEKFQIDHFVPKSIDENRENDYYNLVLACPKCNLSKSGYPYLVSAICKLLDEEIPGRKGFEDSADVWTAQGIEEAVKLLLQESVPLFDSMVKQLDLYPELRDMIEQILYQGQRIAFSPDVKPVNIGLMFGFLKEKDGQIAIANRIFEMRMLFYC